MTPTKQKARELVEKFAYLKDRKENECKHPLFSLLEIQAKQCALICVEEIIKELSNIYYPEWSRGEKDNYWNEVKQEINKL